MQLGCTKKLQDYLKRDISPADQLADPFFSWSADLLTINRHKTVSVVNDCTRCGFVLYGVAAKTMKIWNSRLWMVSAQCWSQMKSHLI